MVDLEDDLDATVDDLDTIFETDLDQAAKKYWLNVAHDFLDERLDWNQFTTDQKARMEALAAADAASAQDPRMYRESVGDATFSYQRDQSETDYWQMLIALDHTGALPAKKNQPKADFEVF